MPVFNLTIDDTSPLIQYSQGWSDSHHTDPLWASYANGTFHATNHFDATASLSFTGTALYLYGANRPNHDEYTVTIDGVATSANGQSSTDQFNRLLYSATNLSNDKHQFVLQDTYTIEGQWWVDVDYIVITAGDGDASTQSTDITLDDTGSSNITYSAGWNSSPDGLESNYYMNTMHLTNTLDASATIEFYGNAISVYGATSTNHGPFSVQLDGGETLVLNGSATAVRYQNLLYWAGGLSPTDPHNLTLANVDTAGSWFDLDKIVVSRWPQPGSSNASATPSSVVPSDSANEHGNGSGNINSSRHKPSADAIAGAVVGGVVAVLAAMFLFLFCCRRRRRRRGSPGQAIHQNHIADGAAITTVQPFPTIATPHIVTSGLRGDKRPLMRPSMSGSPSTSMPSTLASSGGGATGAVSATSCSYQDLPPPDYSQATASRSRTAAPRKA